MRRVVPGKTNEKLPIILKFNIFDIIYLLVGAVVIAATMLLLMAFNVRPFFVILIIVLAEVFIYLLFAAKINENRLYNYVRHIVLYIFRKKKIPESTLKNQLGISTIDNFVKTEGGLYSKIIKVKGIDFSLINEDAQDIKIDQLTSVIANIDKAKIVKMQEPISFIGKIEDAQERLAFYTEKYDKLSEEEKANSIEAIQLESRIKALAIDVTIYQKCEENKSIKTNNYYVVFYNLNKVNLSNDVERTIRYLNNMGLYSYCLDENEVKEFYKSFFDSEENEKGDIVFDKLEEHTNFFYKGGKKYCINTLCDFPFLVDNGWLAQISLIPEVKMVINMKTNRDLSKATKHINKRIVSLGALLLGKQTESDRMEIETQIESLRHLLEQLKFSKEQLHTCDIMLIYEYDKKTSKDIATTIKNNIKARLDPLTFRQIEVYINAFPHLQSKEIKWLQRDFQSSTFAGGFPFISDIFNDEKGDYLGDNSGPVFFDMWSNLNGGSGTRTNANMMTIGASGKGKSYLQKILIKNQLERNVKIFILDPENEYAYIAARFGGNVIDVSGGEMRINPFEIFQELDEEGKTAGGFNILSRHLAFLNDFFQVVIPTLDPFARQVLQNHLKEIYSEKGIYGYGWKKNKKSDDYVALSELKSKDYPTFDDVIKHFKNIKLDAETTQTQEAIEEIRAYLHSFEKDEVYGALWNGETTIDLNNDFIVFNFRGLDSGSQVRNGQMLLITKYLNQEIINNYNINIHKDKSEAKKVVLLVDEAHVFIDPEFPVALDMMKNMAKRIRKYSGSLWVATQNIADFVGFDINTRTKATAVINNCQYTVLFGLKPDDVQQVKEMYSKSASGALTEEEVGYLTMAGQGDALLLVDASTRIAFHVKLKSPDDESNFILPVEYKESDIEEDTAEEQESEVSEEQDNPHAS